MALILASSFTDFLKAQKDCKISKWLSSGNGYVERKFLTVGNYFSFREQSGLVSFCPAGREQQFSESGAWKREGRDVIKPGKLIKKLFPFNVHDSEIEKFVARFKAAEKEGFFSVSDQASVIDDAYENVDCDSCMKGESVGEFYHNAGASILYYTHEGEMVGRAILWKVAEPEITFMDRVYAKCGQEDWIIQKFIYHARENGWYYKRNQTRFLEDIMFDGEMAPFNTMKVVGNMEADFYPYMDTFKTGNDTTLYSKFGMGGYLYEYTGGTRTDPDEDEHEGEVQLENGDWVDEEDAVRVNDSWYHIDDCVRCHRTDDYILESDAYRVQLSRYETIYIHRDYVTEC